MFDGVNIIGPVFGELGIGEDVRSLAHAILALGLPISIVSYPNKGNFVESNRNLEEYVTNQFRYQCNIFCIPLLESYRFFAEHGLSNFEGRYNIGYAPWELESWPAEFAFFGSLFDEIWASSDHTVTAYQKSLDRLIHKIPLIIEPPELNDSSGPTSDRSHVDPLKFNFLYIFDSNSGLSRKNPHDVIVAFQQAFAGQPDVALVLKTMNYQYDDDRLNESIYHNPTITLLNNCLNRVELLSLYRECDAYISLHAAEGFGRTIAEAMLLNKPVIVSNYSGNLDFCTEKTSFLVEGSLEEIKPYDYIFWRDNRWFRPDLVSAASQLATCFKDESLRSAKVQTAHRLIKNSFSTPAIATQIQHRLAAAASHFQSSSISD